MERFQFLAVIDHDTDLKNEPTEFRSKKAVVEHVRRILNEEFEPSIEPILREQGLIDKAGYLILPL